MRFFYDAWKAYCPRKSDLKQLVTSGMVHYEVMLNDAQTLRIVDGFGKYIQGLDRTLARERKTIPKHARKKWNAEVQRQFDRRRSENADARNMVDFLLLEVEKELAELERLQELSAEFRTGLGHAPSASKKQRLILDFAESMGAGRSQLAGDAKAFDRWFSEDAVLDRYIRRKGEAEHRLCFDLERAGHVIQRVTRLLDDPTTTRALWDRLRFEDILGDVFDYEGDARVHVAALRCLRTALEAVEPAVALELVGHRTHQILLRAANATELDVWMQSEALAILAIAEPQEFEVIVHKRLSRHGVGDDIFVRGRAIELIALHSASRPELLKITEFARNDPSPYVRQQWGKCAWELATEVAVQRVPEFWNDKHPQVRAATISVAAQYAPQVATQRMTLQLFADLLSRESDAFVLRTLLHTCTLWLENYLTDRDSGSAEANSGADLIVQSFQTEIVPRIRALVSEEQTPFMQRLASAALERIHCLSDARHRALLRNLQEIAAATKVGKSAYVPARVIRGFTEDELGRTLAVLTQSDFSCDLQKLPIGYRLVRGPVFRFRLWRAIFELLTPATDKRQAFLHTIGRVSKARLRAPSRITGELSQTKVPGEPLVMASEGSYRPFLPLLDDFVSVLNLSWLWPATVKFYSSEGITEVTGPMFPWTKVRAALQLTFRFKDIAPLRNYDDESKAAPSAYLSKLSELGFKLRFRGYDERDRVSNDRGLAAAKHPVVVFFPALLAVWSPELWQVIWHYVLEYGAYFNSTYDSTLAHLTIFAIGALLFFVGKHLLANLTFTMARRRIPLSIGGWGTRGKSGTERLKAALLGAMGHGLVSKTTGCEAMFIQGHAFGEPLEIPLFRPYDKATIWEQKDIFVLASRLNPSVFLWECMGLTPSYVDILQRQWSRDDLGTITNTYPDHEDLQGPAGYNVAETICTFIPQRAHLLTTEQQMLPLIRERCKQANSSLEGVGWLESGLITDDILDRFPYKEHPDNIALVAAMAEQLGCAYDFALKAQADYLVPDLGVLKTYPVTKIRHREIEFTNGMSANERFGCLGNWKRMGYAEQDPYQEPGVWISTVVNNRADRVARSRVFASILVKDVSADRHFLIGGNLKGLSGFIWEAWDEHVETYSVIPSEGDFDRGVAAEGIREIATHFRQTISKEQVQSTVRLMLEKVSQGSELDIDALVEKWDQPLEITAALDNLVERPLIESIQRHHEAMLEGLQEYDALQAECGQTQDPHALQAKLHATLKQWFARKLVPLEPYEISGEQIIAHMVNGTPPGIHNRVMGLQNIKGPGLDFIYRFQAWDACFHAAESIFHRNAQIAEKALQTLASFPMFGQLCQAKVREMLVAARESPMAEQPEFATQLDLIQTKLEQDESAMEALISGPATEDDAAAGEPSSLKRLFYEVAEELLDVNDAARRREKADQIYADLHAERISRQTAVSELRKINKRQKGGWLAAKK